MPSSCNSFSSSSDDGFVNIKLEDANLIHQEDKYEYGPEQTMHLPPEEMQKIRNWLQPTPYNDVDSEFSKHLSSHLPGTGYWLTATETYQEWLDGEKQGMLWIQGIPGSGKSVMAASLINQLAMANQGQPTLYFFFRQIVDANHRPEALLRDWLDQLLEYSPPLQAKLKSYVDADRSIDSISLADMWKDLRLGLSKLNNKVFCVVDALDEMDQDTMDFLDDLAAFGRWNPAKVRLLVTSRPVPAVQAALNRAHALKI